MRNYERFQQSLLEAVKRGFSLPAIEKIGSMANVAQTSASERLLQLPGCLERDAGFSRVVAALQEGTPATIDGAWGSSCALVAAALAKQNASAALLYVCADANELEDIADDLALFYSGQVHLFPAIESDTAASVLLDESYGQRLRTLKLLTHFRPPQVIVTSIQALMQPVPAPAQLADQTRYLRVGDVFDVDEISSWLAKNRYHHTTAVELPGEFSARGGILDIFATDWLDPVRVEMFGDEIESIRRFDVQSQRSLMKLEQVEITVLQRKTKDDSQLADYLPQQAWVMLAEPEQIETEGRQFLQRLDDPREHHSLPDVLGRLAEFPLLMASGLASHVQPVSAHLRVESVERFGGDVAQVRQQLQEFGQDHEALIVAQTEAEAKRLKEILAPTTINTSGNLHFPIGRLRSGFRLLEESVLVLSGAELFGRADLRRMPRRRTGKVIDSFLDLREGDLVVHLAHGIGRYRGLKLLTKDDHVEEHLEIEFHGGTKIYVPASRIELVQKYVGGRKAHPRLAKVGGKQWIRQKEAAQQAVTDLAIEMLQLHAERESQPGIAFAEDTDWQQEFDASFPYHETPDQLDAIEAIKADLISPRPMDRLLCGDVGFGKTEMAMRAAFKAVDNGYQVAVLVPTTILVEQHFRTFQQRMAEFPFAIAKLSRFSTATEQRAGNQILEGGKHRYCHRHSPLGIQGCEVSEPGAVDHRRGTTVWCRNQGSAESTSHVGQRLNPFRDADPSHVAHGPDRNARNIEPGDASRGPPGGRDTSDALERRSDPPRRDARAEPQWPSVFRPQSGPRHRGPRPAAAIYRSRSQHRDRSRADARTSAGKGHGRFCLASV